MSSRLAPLGRPFRARLNVPAAWGLFAFQAPRLAIALGLAALPPLVLVVGALVLPGFLQTVVSEGHVNTTFARFVSTVGTAAAIAVSLATFPMRRELRGVRDIRDHLEADEAFREEVRHGREALPISVSRFLGVVFDDIALAAEDALERAEHEARARSVEGVRLDEFLEDVRKRATRTARDLRASRSEPDRILTAIVDFEKETTGHLARRFARASNTQPLDDAMASLCTRLDRAAVARAYLGTLDTQYSLSRMSSGILLTSFLAVFVSAFMVLAYAQGVPDALGEWGALALVAAALFSVALPLALFVSYLLRFIFYTQHTLSTRGFVLGPDAPLEAETPPRAKRTKPRES